MTRLLLLSALLPLASTKPVATRPAPASFTLRVARPHELSRVAQLQLDIFAPPPEAPPLLPMLQSLYEANQRTARAGMLSRLSDELQSRAAKGSEILIAIDEEADMAEAEGEVDATGQYIEPGQPYAAHRPTRVATRAPPTRLLLICLPRRIKG